VGTVIFADRVNWEGKAISIVRPSVCPFVSTVSFELTAVTFDLNLSVFCVCV